MIKIIFFKLKIYQKVYMDYKYILAIWWIKGHFKSCLVNDYRYDMSDET